VTGRPRCPAIGCFASGSEGSIEELSKVALPTASQPLRTVPHDREAVLELAGRVEDCSFGMLQSTDIQAAIALRPGYQILGLKREQVRQLGNAVTRQ
jgi:DNA (cytosine-5)-methyltransferase 1